MDLGLKCTLIAVAQLIIILYLASNIQAFIIANIYVIWAFISLSLIVASIILESPIAALTETFSAILSLLTVKKVLSICLMFTPEYKLAMLMMNIDNVVGNPVTYAITFSAFIASYYSWSLILKRGDIVIDRIKDLKVSIKGFQKILLAKSFIIIAIASLITLVKPMGFYEEIMYILGVIFLSLIHI